jgi:hypothetical protein
VSASVDIVVPTIGRPSLGALLAALAREAPLPGALVLADDRAAASPDLAARVPPALRPALRVVRSGGRGPAAARNAGLRAATADWVAFLDDDVVPQPGWLDALRADLDGLPRHVAGSQGRLVVPRPARPTDWQRDVGGLERAAFITADMAYRRAPLVAARGFDERFGRAYREDGELAIRLRAGGYTLVRGRRACVHPVPDAGRLVSLRRQAGNEDDALMRALHGSGWRLAAGAPRGRRRRHLAVTASAVLALVALAAGRRRAAALAAAAWLAGTAELAAARIAPGPRTADEVATMIATSVAMPPLAALHWLRGHVVWRLLRRPRPLPSPAPP